MKKYSTTFLQIIIVVISVASFFFMLWEPHIEGRNINATLFEIYFNDPFLIYAYSASIPFFIILYQTFKILEYSKIKTIFSQTTIKSLQIINFCALMIIGFVIVGEIYLLIAIRGKDDIAGGVAIGIFIIFCSVVTITTTSILKKQAQKAIKTNSENNKKK